MSDVAAIPIWVYMLRQWLCLLVFILLLVACLLHLRLRRDWTTAVFTLSLTLLVFTYLFQGFYSVYKDHWTASLIYWLLVSAEVSGGVAGAGVAYRAMRTAPATQPGEVGRASSRDAPTPSA